MSLRSTHPTSACSQASRLCRLSSVALFTVSCAIFLFTLTADADQFPSGVFSLTPAGKPVNANILSHPSVTGVSLRALWAEVEPSQGVYDWTYLDKQIARVEKAGKQILLRIVSGGQNTPQWVFDAGVQTFSFINPNSFQKTYQESITIPVFWDSILLEKKKKLILETGRHFADRPNIVLISASCVNALTDDWNIPSSKTDVENWYAIGYTPEKLVDACYQIVDSTVVAFPNQFVLMGVAQSKNNLDPTPDYVSRQVVEYASTMYPGKFITQRNSLSASIPDPTKLPVLGAWQIIYDNQPAVAGQMLWFVTNDTTCRMNGGAKPCDPAIVLHKAVTLGVRYGMQYQEIYQQDVLNPALADVISDAADMLMP